MKKLLMTLSVVALSAVPVYAQQAGASGGTGGGAAGGASGAASGAAAGAGAGGGGCCNGSRRHCGVDRNCRSHCGGSRRGRCGVRRGRLNYNDYSNDYYYKLSSK